MSQFDSIEVFQGKNLSDIFQEIYTNHTSKKEQIKGLIQSLMPLVQGIGDATLLVPLIKDYLDMGVKNDELLIKLAQIVQRMDGGRKSDDDDFGFGDIQALLAESEEPVKADPEKVEEKPEEKEEEKECQAAIQ